MVDITASLWPCEIEVTMGGWVYLIPALPAAEWIAAVSTNDAFEIVPGLMGEETVADVWDQLDLGEITLEEIGVCARHALEAAAGRPWWEAQHLISGAIQSWDVIGGRLNLAGVNLQEQSIGAFCNTIYALATKDMEKKDRMKFDMELTRPPVDAVEEIAANETALADQFRAAFAEAQRGAN
jgi:hypothetical protein